VKTSDTNEVRLVILKLSLCLFSIELVRWYGFLTLNLDVTF